MKSVIGKKFSTSNVKNYGSAFYYKGSDKKTTKLKEMLYKPNEVSHMMEAHSGLSAKIVENAGFPAIWGSGLSISAQLGYRDANEASWTQVVDVVDYINQATSLPVLLDGDTGFGNFNNARRLVQRLELLGIAGVCLEDKLFPKTNSFITKGKPQDLADIEEFCLKIRACKDAQRDPDFNVVARVEALIADHSMEEAIARADAYYKAGADAILIHSKKPKADEIREFLRIWNKRHPIIIVPTKYASDTHAEEMQDLGVNLMIWANHNIRASAKHMQEVSDKIWANKHCGPVENMIASVDHIFHLQDEKGLAADEKRYLPQNTGKLYLGNPDQSSSTNTNYGHSSTGKGFSTIRPTTSQDLGKVFNYEKPTPKVNPSKFVDHLRKLNVKLITGVPDSLMDNLIEHFPKAEDRSGEKMFHHIAANEGSALAIASGYQVASNEATPPIVYLQNSGLGNLINPLLSLAHKKVYSIPSVIMIGWRGDPSNFLVRDEPQHNVQGKYMLDMLRSMGMDTFILPSDSDDSANSVMDLAIERAKKVQQPVFVVVKAETFMKVPTKSKPILARPEDKKLLTRREAIQVAHYLTKNWKARISTTGKLSRELYEVTSEESICKDFLMVGSMGHVFGFTAGVLQTGIEGNVACFDGDGSILMHAGSLASVNSLPPRSKVLHIGFNNKLHESVGCQPTALAHEGVNLQGIASALGYKKTYKITSESEAKDIIKEFEATRPNDKESTAWFIEWMITNENPLTTSSKKLPRPKETPKQRKELFLNNML